MPRRTTTRQVVLEKAAELLWRQGYYATGLNQILAESGTPKGSLYFHFPGGKEQLAVESVALSGQRMSAAIETALAGADDPSTGCHRLAEAFKQILNNSDFQRGCPVATIALDAANDSDPIRSACAASYQSWLQVIGTALRRWGIPAEQTDSLAAFILSAGEGALLLARVRRDITLIDDTARHLSKLIESTI